jgi:ATP adenylyltransferase
MEYFFSFEKISYLKGKKTDGCILCLIRDFSDSVIRLVVHETPLCIVSLNLYPYNPGHLLVFPKRHVTDIRALDTMERKELNKTVDACLDILDRIYAPEGYNIGYNQGNVAGGSIDHLHMHIIPRYKNELGIAELLGGKKVLVQDPALTLQILKDAFASWRKDNDER